MRLPIGALAGPELAGHGLVDDRRDRFAGEVGGLEGTPFDHDDPERLEILRADEVDVARRLGAAAWRGPAVDDEPLAGGEAVERQVGGQRHALDAGQRGEAGLQPLMEGATGVVRLVGGRERQRSRQQLLGTPAMVAHGEPIDAADEEAGGRQQDERERDLGDDEAVAQAMVGPGRRAAAPLLQRLVDVAARRQPGRQDAEQDAGEHRRARGEGEHRAIERHRQAHLPGDLDARAQRIGRPRGHQQAEATAGEPEQHALDQRLADHAEPRRPERGVQREVAGPADVARQLQVGQVGARDQQHAGRQPHREPRQQANRRIGPGRGERQDGDAAFAIRSGKVAREPRRDRAHARLRRGDRRARLQSSDDGEPVAAAVLPRGRRRTRSAATSRSSPRAGGRRSRAA